MLPLPADRLAAALKVQEYMLGEGRLAGDANKVGAKLAEMLIGAGIPLDRFTSIVPLLHAEAAASARVWDREKGVRSFTFPFAPDADSPAGDGYAKSPAAESHRTGKWVVLWLPDTPDDAYGIVPELKAERIVHYVSVPVETANGMKTSLSFATRRVTGFSDEDLAFLRAVMPAIGACQEILMVHRILQEVTRMYVGEEPHRRILAGDVHRGEVMRMRAAIAFADMRGFTALTANMSAEQATQLLNDYYDCVVPHIEQRGGEVLKLIADGVLAIFRVENEEGEAHACANAYAAAAAGLKAVAERAAEPLFAVGYGLHLGEVAYGNVGSGVRLDYTVIGRDVNFASRIASLCGDLSEPLLVSEAFRQHLPNALPRSRGKHSLKGIAEPAEVYAPPMR